MANLSSLLNGSTPSQVDMGGPVGWGLRGLSLAPGPVGLVGTLASLGLRGNNLGYTNRARASWGQDGLEFGQSVGGLLGLNSYGRGGARDKLGDFRGVDVTPSGMSSRGGFLGFGAEPTGAYTPGEAQRRNAAALYGNAFGTPRVGPAPPAPVQAAPASAPARPSVMAPRAELGIRDIGRFKDDPDPIGSAIRSMSGSLRGDGGGRGNGGAGGGRSGGGGGGRSDRSTSSSGRG
jgi:hypothetical protein